MAGTIDEWASDYDNGERLRIERENDVLVIRLVMFCMFVFLVVTVAAFVYLEWWQAILASLGTFIIMSWVAKKLALSTFKGMMRFANELIETKSRVLRGATIDVHSVKPIAPPQSELDAVTDSDPEDDRTPAEVAEDIALIKNQNWYEIELTLFPEANVSGPMEHWDIYDLRLVPRNAKAINPFSMSNDGDAAEEEEVFFSEIQVIDNGVPRDPEDGKFVGSRRLHFTAGFPRSETEVKFRYYLEQFGLIRLPKALPSITQ